MKHILFLTPYVPSSRAGGENFTRLLLEKSSVNNKIDLIYYRYADDPVYKCPNGNVRVIKEIINSTVVKLKHALMYPTMHPIFTIRFDRALLAYVKQLISENKYDLLYLDHSQMFLYGKYFPEVKKLLMAHDVMAQRFSRAGNWLSKKLILGGEGELMRMPNSTIFTFSEKDNRIVKEAYGLDALATNFFLDQMVVDAVPSRIDKRIVFMGKWKRPDNFDGLKWFFDNVYNKISKDLTISIVGKWLPEQFEARLKKLNNVEYLGFVENPYDMIANSMATISPLFSGAGVKVKVVESLACGTPVIGNDIAFEGIADTYRKFMLHADTPEEYAKLIQEMAISIESRQLYKRMFMENYVKQSIVNFVENY